mgnify:CR=1 FL=1
MKLKSVRMGIYECTINGASVSKGKYIASYYELFRPDLVGSIILPDLKNKKRAGLDFGFPVLVVSYYLGPGDPPKPYTGPVPQGSLSIKAAGSLTNLRKILGIPTRRKKIQKTECWEAVIDERGRVFEVECNMVKGLMAS